MLCDRNELAYRTLIAPYSSEVIRHVADTVRGSIVRAGKPHHRRHRPLECVYLDLAVHSPRSGK
jgi:hypothetical protein